MTSTPEPATAIPFSRIKIRTGALVFCGDDVAFIRRDRAGSTHCAPPGGNVEHGEDLDTAPARELAEELGLIVARAEGCDLLWVIDRRVTRPGPTPPPRKLHLIYRLHITPETRSTLAETELDEQPDGSHETGVIEWIDYRQTAHLPVFPPIGPALAALPHLHATTANAALEAVTDDNYTWVRPPTHHTRGPQTSIRPPAERPPETRRTLTVEEGWSSPERRRRPGGRHGGARCRRRPLPRRTSRISRLTADPAIRTSASGAGPG
ncbi:NUDIX hydrolase [Streptomyces sp. NPDC057217]|uniref:NUDIX hydrolase n=1 Tax=Streptomyces sp. NPDC057217 TaxID=3346054 RepID=UPI00363E96ED